MTLSKNMNGTTALKTGIRHRTAKPARRAFHRRAVGVAPPAVQTGPITVATDPASTSIIRVDRTRLAELRGWGILVGASLAGWITTAIVFGAV